MTSENAIPATSVHPIVIPSVPFQPYYESGGITIYHGDAMQYVQSLPGVDAVVTDPPYGIVGKFGASDLYGKRNMQFAFDQPETESTVRRLSWDGSKRYYGR